VQLIESGNFEAAGQRAAREAETPWDAVTSGLVAGVPALLDEVGVMLRPVAPEYAEFVVGRRADIVVAAEAAMVALVEHAQLCLSMSERSDSSSSTSMSRRRSRSAEEVVWAAR